VWVPAQTVDASAIAIAPVTAPVTTFAMFVSIYPPGGAGARALPRYSSLAQFLRTRMTEPRSPLHTAKPRAPPCAVRKATTRL